MKKFVVLDVSSILYRAFFALPPFKTKDNKPTGGLYGFLSILLKIIREIKPDCILATFDRPEPTFRHKIEVEYKANRPEAPNDLVLQIGYVKEIFQALNIPYLEKSGFEADDIIGFLISKITDKKLGQVIIVTGDSDTFQLLKEGVSVYLLRKGVKDIQIYDINKFKEDYGGIEPEQLVDVKSLAGEPTDNIKGIEGIGNKTAIKLIKEYSSVEKLIENANLLPDNLKEKIIKNKDLILKNKELIKLKKDIEGINFDIENCFFSLPSPDSVQNIFSKFEFKTLFERYKKIQQEQSKRTLF